MFPTKMLLATDGSAGAGSAARLAVGLSGDLDSELHLVYVAPIPSFDPASEPVLSDGELWDMVEEQARGQAEKQAEARRREVEEIGGSVAEAHARVGRVDAEIVGLSDEIRAGLVIVGSRGFGRLKRAVMGSVSTSVLRHSHGSVLVVRGEVSGTPDRILLAMDGSRDAVAARDAAAEISAASGSDVHVVYVLTIRPYRPFLGPEAWEGWEANLERVRKKAHSFLELESARIREGGGKVADTHVASADPAAEIVRLGEVLEAGLIVMGSRGLGGMRRMLLGSVSDSVTAHARCPVLVVRRSKER